MDTLYNREGSFTLPLLTERTGYATEFVALSCLYFIFDRNEMLYFYVFTPSKCVHSFQIMTLVATSTQKCNGIVYFFAASFEQKSTTRAFEICVGINPNTFMGLVGKVQKKRKEGKVERKKRAQRACGGRGSNGDLPRARRGSPAARQGGCLDKQAFPCL